MFKKIINLFKSKKKECFANEDGITHAMCVAQPSCEKCSCYRIKK